MERFIVHPAIAEDLRNEVGLLPGGLVEQERVVPFDEDRLFSLEIGRIDRFTIVKSWAIGPRTSLRTNGQVVVKARPLPPLSAAAILVHAAWQGRQS